MPASIRTGRQPGFAMRLEAVVLPELGTDPDEPIIISHWFASRGDEVWEGDRLVEVLVGPATFDVPAPRSGRVAEIRGREDDRVWPGSVLGLLLVPDDGTDGGSPTPDDAPGRPRP
ncbi:biotin/lipoyl-containing protein [Tautonia plasticadhaerens]|nr:biotin/lipoyl-containing protein [Tautonia plasticadhaerens]